MFGKIATVLIFLAVTAVAVSLGVPAQAGSEEKPGARFLPWAPRHPISNSAPMTAKSTPFHLKKAAGWFWRSIRRI